MPSPLFPPREFPVTSGEIRLIRILMYMRTTPSTECCTKSRRKLLPILLIISIFRAQLRRETECQSIETIVRGLKDGMTIKATLGKSHSDKEKEFNRRISRCRNKIERTPESIRRLLHRGRCPGVSEDVHTNYT